MLKVDLKKIETKKIKDFATKGARVLVGFASGTIHTKYLLELSEMAKTLSEGSGDFPARPFLEEGILSKKEHIRNLIREEQKKFYATGKANYSKIGTEAVKAIQDFVRGDYYKENAPNSKKTIEDKSKGKKMSDKPLIDTGELIKSIHFIVVSGTEVVKR